MPGLCVVSVYEPLLVHRVGFWRWMVHQLCNTTPAYVPTWRACSVRKRPDGLVDFSFVEKPVDCMSCLVEEARRTR